MHPQRMAMERQAKKFMDIYNDQCTGKKLFNFLKTQRKYYTDFKKKAAASGAAVEDQTKLTALQKKCLEVFNSEENLKPTIARNRKTLIYKSATVSIE